MGIPTGPDSLSHNLLWTTLLYPGMTATASLVLNSVSFMSIMDAPHTHTQTTRYFLNHEVAKG